MIKISNRLYSASAVRELDRRAIEDTGIPGIVLMKRAGREAFEALLARWPQPDKITVFCGGGNNGGDGYIIAGLAQQGLIPVEIIQLADEQKLSGDAKRAWAFAHEAGVAMQSWQSYVASGVELASGVVVDALLGIGVSGEVRADYRGAIAHINRSDLPVLAADIPSGLCSDTGAVLGIAVEAAITVTFIGIKVGLLTGRGPALVGELVYRDLAVPALVYEDSLAQAMPIAAQRLDLESLLAAFPARERDAHKGRFGHVLVIGGDKGYGGAVAMAAEAALRVGAGLVSVATRPEHVPALLARRPELMVKGVTSGQELEPHLQGPTLIVIGPGLGRSPWSEQMLQKAIGAGLPMVVDADALNILSEGRVGANARANIGADTGNWILTPHPGEAARLLGCSNADIQADRLSACRQIAEKYSATVLLKGAGTLISAEALAGDGGGVEESSLWLCPYGNPGMASGGMGDVLAGIIGGLLAQGLDAATATCLGACLHSVAADRVAAESGEKGLLASDLFTPLRHMVNAR
ncbi:bifunctional ADP-dependent (S)-NAD(P)H-hydrate dehydratase/NAD(P)H-hydrate epimerase [Gammaproteobacteria bacterium 54_18_T64]|mgnify:CR=1 FL=1|nr:bifunctional ADP-dependent (S)-NAD(P)H-hydrate dehydratase/NAD(P)H-hydrate epimerase [Gammaproteobacteria bacterium 54_18_T64]